MAIDEETRDLLCDQIRRFVNERLIPVETTVNETDVIPEEIIAEMRALGLFGLSISEEYGGLGLSMRDECLVVMELCHAAPAFRSIIGTNVGIGSQGIVQAGTDQQKLQWLPKIASGEVISAACFTEPNVGSDLGSVATVARPTGEGFSITGTKRFITNAGRAQLFTVLARSEPEAKGSRGLTAFLVPADAPGVTVSRPEKKMGQKGAHVHDVIFEDVYVGPEALLGDRGSGFRVIMGVLNRGRLHISAICVGLADRIITMAARYAADRKQFGKRIADHQLIQALLADSQTEMLAARALTLATAEMFDANANTDMHVAAAKLFASEMVGRVADRAVQIYGGAGYIADYGIEALYRDVRLFRIYEGTSQIQQLIIAKQLLKTLEL